MITLISIAICIIALVVMFKITGFFLGIFGKVLGALFGGLGYLLLGVLLIVILGVSVFVVPAILMVGLISIITNVLRI